MLGKIRILLKFRNWKNVLLKRDLIRVRLRLCWNKLGIFKMGREIFSLKSLQLPSFKDEHMGSFIWNLYMQICMFWFEYIFNSQTVSKSDSYELLLRIGPWIQNSYIFHFLKCINDKTKNLNSSKWLISKLIYKNDYIEYIF